MSHRLSEAAPQQKDASEETGESIERLTLEDNRIALDLFGASNVNLKRIERETGVQLRSRGNELTFLGGADAVKRARGLVEQLYSMVRGGRAVAPEDVSRAAEILRNDRRANVQDILTDPVFVGGRAKPIAAKGLAQKRYVDAIMQHDVVFGIGPAGTGKTYLAMAMAVRYLMEKRVKRIILTRPAVEAGERIGYLPGTMEEKVSPYLRPLYDAMHDMMDFEKADHLISRGIIEVAPIAFMRGRTLNDAFVILDEAQNTTGEQMKMFLTRIGYESKAVITGDITQIDLPEHKRSGLAEAEQILRGIEGISFCYFSDIDVVRHPLVQAIIKAYDQHRPTGNERPLDRGGAPAANVSAASEPGGNGQGGQRRHRREG